MSEGDKDWRLRSQENYLLGVEVRRGAYKQKSEEWDHDHCEFCWAKFTERDYPGGEPTLHEGYVANNGRDWICEDCFLVFRERFGWIVLDEIGP